MAQYRQMQPDLRTHQGHVSTSYRFGPYKPANRIRRAVKPYSHRRSRVLIISLVFLFALFLIFLYSRHGSDSDLDLKKLNQTSFQFSRELRFGHGSKSGKDSRYWDKDDRRRDQDYTEEDSPKPQNDSNNNNNNKGKLLYNEGGRKELDSYKEEYEASIDYNNNNNINPEDEYDDGIDAQDEVAMSESEEERERDKNKIKLIKEKDLSQIGKKEKKSGSKKKTKKHKLSSSTCDMKFLNSTAQLTFPAPNTKFAKFSLNYTKTQQNPRFAGHQTLIERENSYKARDQIVNCGFVKGLDGKSTGFDISNDDFKYMSSCHIAVSSCIFGNSDRLRSPFGKTITRLSKKSVCFAMFLDEETLQTLLLEGQKKDNFGFIGFWKIIIIKNMPFNDMRRVGKIPKFLAHRLFSSARYSIWLDSKLRLQSDPILILEYFLWRHENEYAISNHYDRHCVWEEVAQNKKLNKFNHTIIDQQFEFYQKDGLKRFDPLDPNKLLPSYVPEGSFIVREHTPMSNLFSCLWFNEVDRFTPRDQLSFAYTYLKLRRTNPTKPFYLNMFKDCERRSIAKLFHHRSEERHSNPSESLR